MLDIKAVIHVKDARARMRVAPNSQPKPASSQHYPPIKWKLKAGNVSSCATQYLKSVPIGGGPERGNFACGNERRTL